MIVLYDEEEEEEEALRHPAVENPRLSSGCDVYE